jgi:hypothetical protein
MFHLLKVRNSNLILIIAILTTTNLSAQNGTEVREDSVQIAPAPTFVPIEYSDTIILNKLSLPLVYDENYVRVPESFLPESPFQEKPISAFSFSKGKLFEDKYHRYEHYRRVYRNILHNYPHLIKYTKADFPEKPEVLEEMKSNLYQHLFQINYDPGESKGSKPKRFKPKRKYWIPGVSNMIQFSQNYISENWYKGGVGNLNLMSKQSFTLNYKKDKIQFNNLLQWNLSLYTNPNDTLRNTRIAEDLIRLYSDFGIQAFNKWSYSTNIEIKTQFFKNYKENTTNIVSSVLSPIIINAGVLGMKFQTEKVYPKVKGKKISLSADISPLSIQYTNVVNRDVDPARFGILAGEHHLLDYGSSVNANLKMSFNKSVTFTSRLKYFSNYRKVNVESENELNLPINRYFSTRIYVYARFDDTKGLKRDPKWGFLQMNELLSFGFNYVW